MGIILNQHIEIFSYCISIEFPSVYAAVGIHPENLEGCDEDDLETIRRLSFDPKVVAIGEIGLDYHWFSEEAIHQKQKEWFIRQIDLANERGLPFSIHARDAANDTYEILSHHLPKAGAVLMLWNASLRDVCIFLTREPM